MAGVPALRGESETTSFDCEATTGRLQKITKPDGKFTQITAWDQRNRVFSVKDELSHVTSKTYFNHGGVNTLTDARGRVYHFAYDTLGRQTSMTYPDLVSGSYPYESITFGAGGLVFGAVNRAGSVTNGQTYDNRGRLLSYLVAGQKKYIFTYDVMSRPLELHTQYQNAGTWTDETKITYAYWDDGSVNTEQQWNPWQATPMTFTYGWDDPKARLNSLQIPGGETISYSYTSHDQVDTIAATVGGQAYSLTSPRPSPFPRYVGFTAGVPAEAGAGFIGAGGQMSVTGLVPVENFFSRNIFSSITGISSYGLAGNLGNNYMSAVPTQEVPRFYGALIGGGPSLTLTNSPNPTSPGYGVTGPSTTYNIGIGPGFGPSWLRLSASLSIPASGIYVFSIGGKPGAGISVSRYTTDTIYQGTL